MKKTAILILCFCRLWADPLVWSSPPEVLSTAGQNASEPRVGIDANGNFVAAWIENETVIANTMPYNGSWGTSPSVVSSAGGASSPQLVVDPFGNATAIWNQSGTIESATLPFNGSWSAPVALSTNGSSSPQIAVDDSGNLVAIWICNETIQAATQLYNGNWPLIPDNLTDGTTPSDSPQIAIGASGQIVAVWHSLLNATDTIYAIAKNLTGTWGAAQAISNASYSSIQPQIAVDLNGNATAVWYQFTFSNSNYSKVAVQASSLPLGGSWGAPISVSSSGLYNPNNLVTKVQYNQIGMPLVLWNNSYDGLSIKVEGSIYTSNGWITPLTFIPNNLYAYDLDLSVSAGGYAFGAYMFYNSVSASTVIQTSDANTYSAFVNIGDVEVISSNGNNGYPRVSGTLLGPTKYVGAVWLSYDGANTLVQTSVGMGNVISSPTNLTVTQGSSDYGIFTEYFNTLTWEGTPSIPYGGFLIFRNGNLIGAGPTNVYQFVDHNQTQNGSVVYGVAFLESNGNQSSITTINFP